MARTPKRLNGPALVTSSVVTKYTVPGSTSAVVRYIHVSNPSGSAVTLTLSIGADAAGTRILGAYSIPANSLFERHVYIPLATTEIVQAVAGTTNVLTLTIGGDEIT